MFTPLISQQQFVAQKPKKQFKVTSNDFSQNFVDTNGKERPQNFIRDSSQEDRHKRHPQLQELLELKSKLVQSRATKAMCLQADLTSFDLSSLNNKFDVILIDPPWEEYHRRCPTMERTFLTFDQLKSLKIGSIAETPSFLFLWAGSGGIDIDATGRKPHLDEARELMSSWGFSRCEDICWVKTNHQGQKSADVMKSVFVHTKEHCLMGVRGKVRRNEDADFIHCNLDVDVLVAEEPLNGVSEKPKEFYDLIERFCLGRRRLELFGRNRNVRPGWITIGDEVTTSNWDPEEYKQLIYRDVSGHHPDDSVCPGTKIGSTKRIEFLRPKSPPRESEAKRRGYSHGGRGGQGGGGTTRKRSRN
eukprot:TRINITY_DN241_c0_g2_i3.p1 TRINITY_DN241_c0_g2~~TRINITY_DN241_c0_g2_i3.p1  ORF type:complete len:360 (-),score=58.78 TRINITY_DN241_c0_g2_i3:333-1412(-)